jgi:hypothetical protein
MWWKWQCLIQVHVPSRCGNGASKHLTCFKAEELFRGARRLRENYTSGGVPDEGITSQRKAAWNLEKHCSVLRGFCGELCMPL